MDTFYSEKMGCGRYPEKTRGEVFASDRRYFDKEVNKNLRLRHEYARAYDSFLQKLEAQGVDKHSLMRKRIEEGVRLTGEEQVKKIFQSVVALANEQYPDNQMPLDYDYRLTLPGSSDSTEWKWPGHMELFCRLWLRMAIPEIREE